MAENSYSEEELLPTSCNCGAGMWRMIEELAKSVLTRTDASRTASTPQTLRRAFTIGGEEFDARIALPVDKANVAVAVLMRRNTAQPTIEQLRRSFGLTKREAEVAQLLAARLSNKEIARKLNFTIYTAKRHTEHVLGKLGLSSRRHVQAVVSRRSSGMQEGAQARRAQR